MKRPEVGGESTSFSGGTLVLNLKVPLPASFQALSLKEYRLARAENSVTSSSSPVWTTKVQMLLVDQCGKLTILMIKLVFYFVTSLCCLLAKARAFAIAVAILILIYASAM